MILFETLMVLAAIGGLYYYVWRVQDRLKQQQGDTKFLKEYVQTTITEANDRFFALMDDLEPLLTPLREYKEKLLTLIAKAEKIPWEDVEEKVGEFQWILDQFSDIDWSDVSDLVRNAMDRLPSILGTDQPQLSVEGLENQILIK